MLKKIYTQFQEHFPFAYFSFLMVLCNFVGLFFSRALLSISMMGLIAIALLSPQLKKNVSLFLKSKSDILLTGMFFLYAISYFWSEDKIYWSSRLQLMGPFLVLPIAFISLPQWEKNWWEKAVLFFILLCFGGVCWSSFYYAQHFQEINSMYKFSKTIPTPFKNDHIRFSLSLVISIICCGLFLFKNNNSKIIKISSLVLGTIFIVFLHILSVRSALISLYLVAFYFLIIFLIKQKSIKNILILISLASLFIILMYNYSAPFKAKINYTKWTFEQFNNPKAFSTTSDGARIFSYKAAFQIFKNNPIIGVGTGDVHLAMKKEYLNLGVPELNIIPHNQFLLLLVSLGIIGFVYFIVLLFFLKKKVSTKNIFI
ncbi:MAG: O-antigen ligase family protein, partial [Chitinophagaceae bacterium]|nr:O-antigen ligase family protein [Chitinophagaceae bacterium]